MLSSIITYIYSIVAKYAYRILPHRQPLDSVSNLSTQDRESLLCEVSNCLHWHLSGVGDVGLGSSLEDVSEENHRDRNASDDGVERGLAELDAVLEQCRESLEKYETKERFVGVRIRRYRELLSKARETHDGVVINMTCNDLDEYDCNVASEGQKQPRQKQCQRDEIALQSVEELHKGIIAEIEVLRRRIRDLEEKKQSYIDMREECREFVLAAAVDGC